MTVRKRKNGRLVKQKRPDSAGNAKPHKVSIVHAGGSRALMRDPLDLRTRVGKAYYKHKEMLRAHIGGDPSLPQEALIDQAARLALLEQFTWNQVMSAGVFDKKGALAPAYDAFIKAAREQRQVLVLLGIERKTKQLTLSDVLDGEANEETS